MKIKFNKWLFSVIAILLGFSGTAAAQYGVVVNSYRIKGNVISEKCRNAIPNIKITLRTTDANGADQDKETYTDAKGNFIVELDKSQVKQNEKYFILVEDVDGNMNSGDFQPTRIQQTFSLNDFIKAEYNGDWIQYYDNKNMFNFELKLRNDQPCEK